MKTARPLGGMKLRTLAVLSGVLTGLIAGVAYFLVPLVRVENGEAGEVRNTVELSEYVFDYFISQSILYPGVVLVIVPLMTTAVTVTLARRAGHNGHATDVAVVTAVVAGPVVMVWLGVFVALGAIAIQAPAIAVWGAAIALVIGVALSAVVALVVTVSAVSGYALAEGLGSRLPT